MRTRERHTRVNIIRWCCKPAETRAPIHGGCMCYRLIARAKGVLMFPQRSGGNNVIPSKTAGLTRFCCPARKLSDYAAVWNGHLHSFVDIDKIIEPGCAELRKCSPRRCNAETRRHWRRCYVLPAPEHGEIRWRCPRTGEWNICRCTASRKSRGRSIRKSLPYKSQVCIPVQHVGQCRGISGVLVDLASCVLQGVAYVRRSILHLLLQIS